MEIRDIIAMASVALTLLLFLYTRWALNQDKGKAALDALRAKVEAEFKELNVKQDEDERRLSHMESVVNTLPDKDVVHRLEMDLSEVKGGMRVLETEVKPISLALQRIEKFLLDNSINSKATRR